MCFRTRLSQATVVDLLTNRKDVAKRTITNEPQRGQHEGLVLSYQFDFSALPRRSLRLCGESQPRKARRRDAEAAKDAQGKAEIKTVPQIHRTRTHFRRDRRA